MKRTLLKKALLTVFITFEVFFLSTNAAFAFSLGKIVGGIFGGVAGAVGGAVVDKAIGKIEKRYHIDNEAVSNIGEGLNVVANKGYAPEVDVLFSPQNPQPGQRVTARAFAKFFSNTEENLYYTWYLTVSKGKGVVIPGQTAGTSSLASFYVVTRSFTSPWCVEPNSAAGILVNCIDIV